MKVLVNCLSARRGGSRVFLTSILPVLARMDTSISYSVIIPEPVEIYFPQQLPGNVIPLYFEAPGSLRRLWREHVNLPFKFKSLNFDCYFQADDTLPPLIYFMKGKKIAVFHESITLLMPNTVGDSKLKVWYWKFLKWLSIKKSSISVAMSYCEKGELARGDRKIFKKLRVIYHGIDHSRFNLNSNYGQDKGIIDLPDSFILSVSTRNPHKNYIRLVQAYALLFKQGKIKEHLVLIGSPVLESEESRIKKIIRDSHIEEYVHIYNDIENSELPSIYRKAHAYVYASLFDSFGFTPLEAMACGTPCAVSRFSALPEICGDSVEYFDPLNIQSIADAIEKVVNDNIRRAFLIEMGIQHAKKFSWEKSASEYHSLITSSKLTEWSL